MRALSVVHQDCCLSIFLRVLHSLKTCYVPTELTPDRNKRSLENTLKWSLSKRWMKEHRPDDKWQNARAFPGLYFRMLLITNYLIILPEQPWVYNWCIICFTVYIKKDLLKTTQYSKLFISFTYSPMIIMFPLANRLRLNYYCFSYNDVQLGPPLRKIIWSSSLRNVLLYVQFVGVKYKQMGKHCNNYKLILVWKSTQAL